MFINQMLQGGIRAILAYDPTVFDDIILPDDISADDVIERIIFKYGDTPLFAPDPAVIKFYIRSWSKRRLPLWERFIAAVTAEYDPLENYDRIEDSKDKFTHGHNVTTDDDLTHGLTIENQISADNVSTYQPDNKGINSGKDQRDITEKHTGTDLHTVESRTHGNIGVTTSQQMLTSELDLIPRLDIIDYIADDFHSEFCLYIY